MLSHMGHPLVWPYCDLGVCHRWLDHAHDVPLLLDSEQVWEATHQQGMRAV